MSRAITIHLIERGSAHVVAMQDWFSADCERDARELVKLGVIKISISQNHVLIEPKTLIGSFISKGLKLYIASKIDGVSNFVISNIKNWRKFIDQENPGEKGSSLGEASSWRSFEILLKKLHNEGLPWEYNSATEETSTPRGRILFKDTITKLHSRGISHRVFSRKQVREYLFDLALCLDAVRRKLDIVDPVGREEKYCVQRLIDMISERENIISEVDAFIRLEPFLNIYGRPALGRIAYFGRKILEGKEEYRISERVGSGIAEFVDMEKLWEHAVHMLVQMSVSNSGLNAVMHPLRSSNTHLFNNGGPKLDPDIIVFDHCNTIAIVDAKYSLTSTPSASDVYQITSYCTRLKANMGLLAYVSDNGTSRISKIGCLDNGVPLFACFLSLDAFDAGDMFFESALANVIAAV